VTVEALRAHQYEVAAALLSDLHRRCRLRFIAAARLVGVNLSQWPELLRHGTSTSIDLGPLLPFWDRLCARFEAELFDPQMPLLDAVQPPGRQFDDFVATHLWPAVTAWNECVRNVLRATGSLPSRDRRRAAGALVAVIDELPFAPRLPFPEDLE
jgi:hypothetical protein